MFFKERPFLVCLLLGIVIVFSFVSTARDIEALSVRGARREGYSGLADSVPSCSDSDDTVAACYSSVVDSAALADYTSDVLDKYMLKTEMLTPICPSCPSTVNGHSHGSESEADAENKILGSEYNETNVTNITNEENIVNNTTENVSSDTVVKNG